MKALLRKSGDQYYVWKNVRYEKGDYIDDEGYAHSETEFLTIKDGDVGYVACNNCGAKIKNDPVSIEQHYATEEAKRNCLTCRNVHPESKYNKTISISKNDEGIYIVTETCKAGSLRCGYSWQRDIDSVAARNGCVHYQCRRNGVRPYGGILMNTPDLFETQITSDLLIKKKYNFESTQVDAFLYDLKCRGTFFAVVNACGIVDHFMLRYQYNTYWFCYSAKYDKLFYAKNGEYTEGKPRDLSDTKYDQIKKRVESLYKEVKTNE